jgi:hypothetical protein
MTSAPLSLYLELEPGQIADLEVVTVVGSTAYVLEAKLNYQRDPALKGKDPAPFKAFAVPLK